MWVFLTAGALRLFVAMGTLVVNPDGVDYINQARAIYWGEWDSLTTCNVDYVSILPFLIAAVFGLVGDWVWAGRLVSLLFGFGTLVPLYLLLKPYLDKTGCVLTLWVYALIPFMVRRSADIVRDPVAWFFLCLGMCLFVRQDQGACPHQYRWRLSLSCLCYLAATWARLEGIFFVALSAGYLLVRSPERKAARFFFFLLPLLLISAIAVIPVSTNGAGAINFHRFEQIHYELSQFIAHYRTVRTELGAIASQHSGYLGEFFRQVRGIVWLLPLGLIFNCLLEAFFYPYAFIWIVGFFGIRQRMADNRMVAYFLWAMLGGIGVLYIHLFQSWLLYHRFLAILILPSCLIVGFGLDNCVRMLQNRFNLQPAMAAKLVLSFILLFGLSKNLRPAPNDKIIYRQAGELIADQKAPEQVARIAAANSTVYEWVFFYAHLDYPGALCAHALLGRIPSSYPELLAEMQGEGIQYVLYEEKRWPREGFEWTRAPIQNDFNLLGKWWHRDTGQLVLLQRYPRLGFRQK